MIDELRQLGQWWHICIKAADEIEWLRAENQKFKHEARAYANVMLSEENDALIDDNKRQAQRMQVLDNDRDFYKGEYDKLYTICADRGAKLAMAEKENKRLREQALKDARIKASLEDMVRRWETEHEPKMRELERLREQVEYYKALSDRFMKQRDAALADKGKG